MIEKLAFTLVTTSRKLRHYFQAYVINVLTDHPLKKVMNKLEATRRLIQWAIEMRYQPRNAIKAQVLIDFIAKFTPSQEELDELDEARKWAVSVDGSSTLYVGGIGVIIKSSEGDKLRYAARL